MKKSLLGLLALSLIFASCSLGQDEKNTSISNEFEEPSIERVDINERLIEDDERDKENHGIDDHDIPVNEKENNKENNTNEEENEKDQKQSTPSENIGTDDVLAELNGKKFIFMSGAGGWKTDLFFEDNGNFYAEYVDGDYDTSYVNKFSGQFSVDKKLSNTAYILNLDHAQSLSPVGTEEVKNIEGRDMNIVYTDLAYGFAVDSQKDRSFQDKFTLYLPFQRTDQLNSEVNNWINIRRTPYINDNESRVFLLVNNSTFDTFIEDID